MQILRSIAKRSPLIMLKAFSTIRPDGKFKLAWEIYVLFVTILITIFVPLRVVFPFTNPSLVLLCDLIGTITFTLDIFIKFHTGVMIRHKVIQDKRFIAKHYLKNGFIWDLLAAVPFSWILALRAVNLTSRVIRYFLLFRLFKLISIIKTLRRAHRMNIVKPALIRLILLVFWILIAAHLISCGWIFIDGPRKLSIGSLNAFHLHYLEAFYWTVTTLTTIGYGDITPETTLQFIYVIIVMLIGAALYGFIIGNIANIIANLDVVKSKFRNRVENISTFLKYRNVPGELQSRISDYFDYLWESRRGYEESNLLRGLPVSLLTQVSYFLNKEIIEQVPIFKNASQEFIRDIIMNLKPVIYTPGDNIVTSGELGYEMFFIAHGEVEVMNDDGSIVYATLTNGQFFGEIAILLSTSRTATVRAKVYCDLYVLHKDTFDRILQRYPNFAKDVEKQAEENRKKLGLTSSAL